MSEVILTGWRAGDPPEALLTREWLVTNGLGGYASGTLGNVNTRRYHGVLVSAQPMPFGRMLMLKHVAERIQWGGEMVALSGPGEPGPLAETATHEYLIEFRLEGGLPVWRYRIGDIVLEKRIAMPHRQNSICLTYRLLEGDRPVRLELLPSMHFRPHEGRSVREVTGYAVTIREGCYEVTAGPDLPTLRMRVEGHGHQFVADHDVPRETFFRVEAQRGSDPRGVLWHPGYFGVTLFPGSESSLTASTEPWHEIDALHPRDIWHFEQGRRRHLLARAPECCRSGLPGQLVLAADQFLITPAGRVRDRVRAFAEGNDVRTVIAGYHWFTDWGRDTMIGLEGLALTTGRPGEANSILRTFADYITDGLIPNMFPEKGEQGLYHTADASLWFFHAVDRYLQATDDRRLLSDLLPQLYDMYEHHLRGTRFGIRTDRRDGLLTQGQAGFQLTWMDAKVGDWVVTPRRGKAVEINALWYNALRLLAGWLEEVGQGSEAAPVAELADRVRASFNERFWYEAGGHLYDVIDGEFGADPACRPNQIFAIALPHPVLDPHRWQSVLSVVHDRLLTPVGLRSLAPGHPDYKSRYFGDLHSRDAAYHQGTVWSWLIGPFIDAWLRVYPDQREKARGFLDGFWSHLRDAGIGSVSEIFDAESPYTARGCIAQAWSVAELLRCYVKTAEPGAPGVKDRG